MLDFYAAHFREDLPGRQWPSFPEASRSPTKRRDQFIRHLSRFQ